MSSPTFTLLEGDVLDQLATLPDESVHCVVTSPPYWGLRDYGTGTWEGGDPGCGHLVRNDPRTESSTLGGGKETTGHQREGFKQECGRCGARRVDHQLGLEATPGLYVERMVAVFREVRRVLRSDGTCWLNIGDSYNANGREGHGTSIGAKQGTNRASANGTDTNRPTDPSLKPKDLVGIPWRLAFGLQADGWWLRSEIIWAKPNSMPESVTDRPTKAHEQVFLLTKSARYFYDADAVREPATYAGKVVSLGEKSMSRGQAAGAGVAPSGNGFAQEYVVPPGRNLRSVWSIPTEPYPEAHFATYPTKLVEPCVKAGCPEGGVVLDPFLGSGTTAYVALALGRSCVGIELNPEYAALARRRVGSWGPKRMRLAQTTIDHE